MYTLLDSNTSTYDENSSSQPQRLHHYDSNLPFLQDHDGVVLSYLLSQQQFLMMDTNSSQSAEFRVAASNQGLMEEKIQSSKKKKKAVAPRKRNSGKKDRHSKICTAQGPRDRRMRLSVQIARKFFDLQDLLGFDKASKTIDWLFTKSKSAIKELKHHLVLPRCSTSTIGTANYMNSLSTSAGSNEVVSQTMQTHCAQKGESSIGGMNKDPKQNLRRSCKVWKGSRDEARARARERTREKMRIRLSCQTNQDEENPKDLGLSLGKEAEKLTNHELVEPGGTISMMRNNTDDHRTLMRRSVSESRSRSSFEGEFPGFTGSGNSVTKMQSFQRTTNLIKTLAGNSVLQVENPSAPIMGMTTEQQEPSNTTTSHYSFSGSNSQEQNYSGTSKFTTPIPKPNTTEVVNPYSINFMPSDQDQNHNRNSFFITTLISQHQNSCQFLKFN